jgi:hypothetical protein
MARNSEQHCLPSCLTRIYQAECRRKKLFLGIARTVAASLSADPIRVVKSILVEAFRTQKVRVADQSMYNHFWDFIKLKGWE